MKQRIGRFAVVFVSVVVVFGGLGAWLLPGLVDKRPACERADQWVSEHRANLPATFAEVTAFPPPFRQRIFNALPATAKADLWKTHLTNVLNGRRLSAEQRAVVAEALAMVQPERYEPTPDASSFAPFAAKAERSFSRSEINELFLTLGPPNGSWRTLRSARVMLTEGLRKRFGVSAARCDCSWGCSGCYLPTGPNYGFQCMPSSCIESETGCGWFWWQRCEYYCRWMPC